MDAERILWPMLVLMLWTLCVLLRVALARLQALRAGAVGWQDFAVGESARVPDAARRANRALVNLLEMPVIFYALMLAGLASARADATVLALAWAYVALRIAHTIVYLTYNRVTHRFVVFGLGNLVLLALLLRLAWRLM